LNLYLLQRPGKSWLISSDNNPSSFQQQLKQAGCFGWFGSYPDEEARTEIKNRLYEKADYAAEKAFHEKDFFLRYLFSLFVFLFCYFFLSYVVRDPIPLVDELAVSIGASVLFNIWYRRKRSESEACRTFRFQLRTEVDAIPFEELELVRNLELFLQNLDQWSIEKKIQYKQWQLPVFLDKNDRNVRDLYLAIGSIWPRSEIKKQTLLLKSPIKSDQMFEDLSLFLVYLKLRHFYSTV